MLSLTPEMERAGWRTLVPRGLRRLRWEAAGGRWQYKDTHPARRPIVLAVGENPKRPGLYRPVHPGCGWNYDARGWMESCTPVERAWTPHWWRHSPGAALKPVLAQLVPEGDDVEMMIPGRSEPTCFSQVGGEWLGPCVLPWEGEPLWKP